jgi:hypothetical protein
MEMILFSEDFLHLADFLLDLSAYLFAGAFAFQVRIVRQLAHLFLNGALHFVNLARDLISFSGLGFILWPPLTKFAFHSARRSVLRLHRAPEIAGSEHLALREPV